MSNPSSLRQYSSPMSFPSSNGGSGLSSKHEEDLINAYEAEEERIINVLSRKLERLREEKVNLENALEAESESHVIRLSRELSSLRLLQQQQQQNGDGAGPSTSSRGGDASERPAVHAPGFTDPRFPGYETMLEAIRRENENLRNRLVDTERAFIRVTRLNEIYREELIEHRRRLGLSVDSLIGLHSSSQDPLSQPTHRRESGTSSPASSAIPLPHRTTPAPVPIAGLPIPRPPSQTHTHRPSASLSDSSTPLTVSPSSLPSSPFSPGQSGMGLTGAPSSYLTQYTTPPSSTSPLVHLPFPHAPPSLSYPSVPPPSLSSSLGSPVMMFQPIPPSPTVPLSRRSSTSQAQSANARRMSTERGARVAETGSLRDRRQSGTAGAGSGSSSGTGARNPVT
ncbi:hypothetical protein BOTBODRAFT_36170 [Botryobasidium botryosum FD-172 SS1]|uniref:Uncharacterized protein n=1 Tax=Botryobasidium botryosum (strain FD-172 SS1) TaxID=930990 RepID=A0A067MFX4_BOTB1|nr:hypothetical protein BOTBODRAFT_36170 [Botryobasidium botryosum FD-172 SS1]